MPEDDPVRVLGRRLDTARRQRGWTYREFARHTGMSKSTLQYLVGTRRTAPDYYELVALVGKLGEPWTDEWERLWRRAVEGPSSGVARRPEWGGGRPGETGGMNSILGGAGDMTGVAVRLPTGAVNDAAALLPPIGRRLLGITGVPGVGKSTVTAGLATELGRRLGPERVAIVPMDGFHLANAVLEQLGRQDRKGAPDTFDAAGFAALLSRVRTETEHPVYAPAFHREIEESVAGEIVVGPAVRLVLVEGNYLLHWSNIRHLLDAVWYLETVDDDIRLERLIARHETYGKSPAEARAWALGSDEANADIVRAGRHLADRVITIGVRG